SADIHLYFFGRATDAFLASMCSIRSTSSSRRSRISSLRCLKRAISDRNVARRGFARRSVLLGTNFLSRSPRRATEQIAYRQKGRPARAGLKDLKEKSLLRGLGLRGLGLGLGGGVRGGLLLRVLLGALLLGGLLGSRCVARGGLGLGRRRLR